MTEGLSRRELLCWGVAAGGAALAHVPWLAAEPGVQATAAPGDPSLAAAFTALDAFVVRHLKEQGLPGLTHALASRDGTLRTASYGLRDVKTREPLTTDDLFEIGSISKSFVALAALQLREEGKLDLDRPLREYLPWLRVDSGYAPITPHHLLTHSSGLPGSGVSFPLSESRPLWTAHAPGEAFHYCNLGYDLLGLLLEKLDGRPLREVLRARVFARLGMQASEPIIVNAMRHRLPTSYWALQDDRPLGRGGRLVEAPQLTFDGGAGCIASTPGDMALYLRMLLNRGAAPEGRVVSEESFALFSKRWIDAPAFGQGAAYGYGIAVVEIDGHRVLRHTGGMVSFSSALHADLDAGIGSFASVHASTGGYRPNAVGLLALALLRAAREARPLPEAPPPDDAWRFENPAAYAGAFTAPDARRLELEPEGESLWLRADGERIRLQRGGADRFLAPGSRFALFPLEVIREGDAISELAWGGDWYAGAAYTGPRRFEVPAAWRAYVGAYRNDSPWYGTGRVVLRKDRLLFAGEPLLPLPGGQFRFGEDETGTERVRFSDVVDGRAMRMFFSETEFRRVDE
jgi:CubicO group peptidase (beta-lactamase class C family)